LARVSNDQSGTSYNPGALDTGVTYYWRIDEQNVVDTTTGDVWSFTTTSSSGPSKLLVSSIVLGTASAGKGRKHGQAIVAVEDDLGNEIAGVTVTGEFSGSFNQTVPASTSGSGQATLTTSTSPQKRNISYTFCVVSISVVSGLTYSLERPDCKDY
jgi:hypothetical protein